MDWASLKHAGGKITSLAQGVFGQTIQEGLEKIGTRLIVNSKNLAEIGARATKIIKSLATKQLGVLIKKQVIQQTLNPGVDKISSLDLEYARSTVFSEISSSET